MFVIRPLLARSSRRGCVLVSQGVGWSAVPWVVSFLGCFPLLVVHVGPSLFEESIECPGWFDANGLPELRAQEESPLEQILFHVIGTEDLDGLAVETIYKLLEGLVASLDDNFESNLRIWMSTRDCEGDDELVL